MIFLRGLVFTGVIVTVTLDCRFFQTRKVSGRDLFKAKTVFGTVVRGCKSEIREVVRVLSMGDIEKRLNFYCNEYTKCRRLVNTTQELANCGRMELLNESSPVHVEMHEPPEFVQAAEAFMSCSLRIGAIKMTLEDFDNAAAFAYRYWLNYG